MQTIRTNLTNGAPSQYTNYNFNSMIVFNGTVLGAGPSGLRKLCCGDDDDAGTQIDAHFVPATGKFGMDAKRNSHAYFRYECDGDMQISMTGDGKTTIGPYTVTAEGDEGAQERRVNLGKGLKYHYGSFKVGNVGGAQFSIDEILLRIFSAKDGK